ncbi:hypothetical protein MKX01_010013, partial [Papaver californicum]
MNRNTIRPYLLLLLFVLFLHIFTDDGVDTISSPCSKVTIYARFSVYEKKSSKRISCRFCSMDEENSINENKNENLTIVSRNHSPGTEPDSSLENTTEQQNSEKAKGEDEKFSVVPFFRLFAFADSKDTALMVIGVTAAFANGATMPLMSIIIGNLVNSFGNTAGTKDVVKQVSN